MNDPDVKLLATILVAAAMAVAVWFFWDNIFPPTEEPVVVQSAPAVEPEPENSGPLHPVDDPGVSTTSGELVPLPSLDDSDSYFLLALIDTFGPGVETTLVNEALIDKFVATIDNLPRPYVPEKIRPTARLAGPFVTITAGDEQPVYLSAENYRRYDSLVNVISNANPDTIVAAYRRFYPLLQESYKRLGYPDAYFNDRVVAVIDHLLQTPRPKLPVRLVQPNVLYQFADADLEALSSGQKLMLRIGSDNAASIRKVLANLRARIAQPVE